MARVFLLSLIVGVAAVFLAVQVPQAYAGGEVTDPTTSYTMVTQKVAGGPEVARCISTECYLKVLTCPNECKKRSTVAPGKSACMMDCKVCKATCKHRKPNCYGFGAICYDPRFIGGDGVMFYFHGQKDRDFCIVSDRNLHINAHFIGKRPEGRARDYTWVQGLGIVFDSHKLTIAAKQVGAWIDEEDHFSFSYDGVDFSIPLHESALWTSADGKVVIERTSESNSAHVAIDGLMEVSLDVIPITDKDSRVHNYQVTDENRFAHLQMQFTFHSLSSSVSGVLGQTYRPNFKTTVNTNVPMPVLGGDENYLSSSLLSTDCSVNQFSSDRSDSELEASPILTKPVQCNSQDGTMSCRR